MTNATTRVTADREICVGAGMCALTAPAVFDQDDDGIVTVLAAEPDGDARAAARKAATLCPSGAVRVTE
ncbi:ferredoxin [Streptomyces boncukensis]|uniref:Ferredoxin n=1 Tax=Streptomyces boncukensis TaxID=2711219 RepID=A0A6G4WWV5_9ACTN|nr:(4Fe-4S)-binding protein [Streptomyces boncukensis]NGO69766.1 ferredoxin [Streptomyces boncukensis]